MTTPDTMVLLPSQALDPRVVVLWRLDGLIRLSVLFGPLLLGGYLALAAVTHPGLAAIPVLLVSVVLAAWTLVWPSLAYTRFRFAVRADHLWIRNGVLFRMETVIPLSRIQHVDSRQGPIERLLGLSRVVVFTASGMVPDGGIPGLDTRMAAELRDALARRGGADGV